MNWYKTATNSLEQLQKDIMKDIKKDEFRYCPICGEFQSSQCRCSGPHNLEALKKGHGFKCKNGHRWSGNIVYNPSEEN